MPSVRTEISVCWGWKRHADGESPTPWRASVTVWEFPTNRPTNGLVRQDYVALTESYEASKAWALQKSQDVMKEVLGVAVPA